MEDGINDAHAGIANRGAKPKRTPQTAPFHLPSINVSLVTPYLLTAEHPYILQHGLEPHLVQFGIKKLYAGAMAAEDRGLIAVRLQASES